MAFTPIDHVSAGSLWYHTHKQVLRSSSCVLPSVSGRLWEKHEHTVEVDHCAAALPTSVNLLMAVVHTQPSAHLLGRSCWVPGDKTATKSGQTAGWQPCCHTLLGW